MRDYRTNMVSDKQKLNIHVLVVNWWLTQEELELVGDEEDRVDDECGLGISTRKVIMNLLSSNVTERKKQQNISKDKV